ncbi:ABI-1-like 1 [Actinidia rufa]|uniref:ABI-1-like 1 n=1 Tax=Actinidia rufa TaxID=165716 RepID=A0A7J0FFC9_9ERIC|nr:ABI-1-like 1 [Actinidia rufa]
MVTSRVLDNLKDYAVRALVNAVDHLGTVACKLTDVLEQQTLDVSTIECKASCLNQQLLTCQAYMDKEGLRQQQVLALIPRHHKHYTLPSALASKTVSWHLASETKSTLKAAPRALMIEDAKASGTASAFHLVDAEEGTRRKSSAVHVPLSSGMHASSASMQTFGATRRDSLEGFKPLTAFKSFDNPIHREIVRAPVRSKILRVFVPWIGMPQGLFLGSRSSLFRCRDYTLAAAASVAKNGTVIVCAVSQPYLPFLLVD